MSPSSITATPLRLANRIELKSSKASQNTVTSPSKSISRLCTTSTPQKATRKRQLAGDQTTESADSEDVQPSGSGYFDLNQEMSLDDEFPSLPRIINALNRAYFVDKDSDAFRALGDIFANLVLTVSTNIENNSQINRTSEKFIFAKSIVRLLLDIFRNVVEKVSRIERIRTNKMSEMRDAYEHAVMVHGSLSCLHRIGLEKSPKHKPLPPLPLMTTISSSYIPSLPASPPKAPPRPATPGQSTLSSHTRKNSATSLRTKQSTPSPKDKSFKWPKNKSDSSNSSQKTPPISPSFRHPFSRPAPLETTLDGPRSEEIYNQRWTAVYFGDSSFPCDNITLEEGAEGFEIDKNNKIRAATLPALIRILTSREGVQNPTLSQSILASFRHFTTPAEFFNELKQRFDAKPPPSVDITNHKDASKWAVKLFNIHTRVLAVIYTWLDQHWKIDTDNTILDDIRAFVHQVNDKDVPRGVVHHILERIEGLEHCSEQDLFEKQLCNIASIESLRLPPLEPTHFAFPKSFPTSSLEGLEKLDTKEGREELARHLTLKMSELYRKLDPTKVVKFWYEEGDNARNYAKYQDQVPGVRDLSAISLFGEQLTFWVMSSVVDNEELHKRVHILGFWTEVALRCMAHHDYAIAHNIYASLSYSSIRRMKESIIAVPESIKLDYKKLSDFFEDRNNTLFKRTFNNLSPTIPSTGPLLHDICLAKNHYERESRYMPFSDQSSSLNLTSRFIPFDQCRVNQQAIRYLNKALIKYNFERNGPLASWLEDRIRSFIYSTSREKQAIYDRLYDSSVKLEHRHKELDFISNPWHYITSKPTDPLKGNISQLDFLVQAPSDQKKIAKRLLSLLGNLKKARN
ncbi:ras guanine nucleotide exchange factor domain-containing protein [Crepidotus variabilis]|uniref:Ras guanine nucleotide exchange factor domain-containing protein n=1 Tax=Crepidotus variabilis TaxID=179855 RepID=A0A9P6JTI2_9AGAR|nr:ras guanine nucleotide exchange factor domain-containing protein [Crepidotus variabilis]